MFLMGVTWQGLLAWNLRQAGALWAAWAGGASTMREAFESDDGTATIKRTASISKPEPPDEEEASQPKRRHLRLVP